MEILTRVTPNLGKYQDLLTNDSGAAAKVFWPSLDAKNRFKFSLVCTDRLGNRIPFSMPLIFIDGSMLSAETVNRLPVVFSLWGKPLPDLGLVVGLNGQQLAYTADGNASTRFPTEQLVFFGRATGDARVVEPKLQILGINVTDILVGGGLSPVTLQTTETTDELTTTMSWTVDSANFADVPPIETAFRKSPDPNTPTKLTIRNETRVHKNGGEAVSTVQAELSHFSFNLAEALAINFRTFGFTAEAGKKPDLVVDLDEHGVEFLGALSFVNELRKFIPSNGFSDPPDLQVTPSGVVAGYTLGLPTINVGYFAMSNIALGARFELPFDDRPISARFNFSQRHNMFTLTVSALGGCGFLAIVVDKHGIQQLEGAIAATAALALDLGVASGAIYARLGVAISIADDKSAISAFLEMGGEMSVLALVSMSITFHMKLTYEAEGNDTYLVGQATLEVEVDVRFLSESVSLHVERRFAGSAADPTFFDAFPAQPGKPGQSDLWAGYCGAFVPESAPDGLLFQYDRAQA